MRTIYKYQLDLVVTQVVMLPKGAEILTVQKQFRSLGTETMCMWALVDPDAKAEPRTIFIQGTGFEIHADFKRYIATVQDGPYVWHVFE